MMHIEVLNCKSVTSFATPLYSNEQENLLTSQLIPLQSQAINREVHVWDSLSSTPILVPGNTTK